MKDQYELMYDKLLKELEQVEKDLNIQEALNRTLPNYSDETDYDAWIEGSKKFANDNYDLLKEWVK